MAVRIPTHTTLVLKVGKTKPPSRSFSTTRDSTVSLWRPLVTMNSNWDPYCHITAAELFQCLITGIMNGGTSMRLEFIVTKGLHKLTFESREEEKLAWSYLLSAPRLCVLGSLLPYHSS
eukprot:scaffold46053_cov43-Cyclotella_meneghiniana.AAC.1